MSNKIKKIRVNSLLIARSIEIYKRHWFDLFVVALFVMIPFLFFERYFGENFELRSKIAENYSLGILHVLDILVFLVIFLFILLWISAIFISIKSAHKHVFLKPFDAYKEAFKIFRFYFRVKCLYLSKVFGWALFLILPGLIFAFSSLASIIDGKIGMEALIYSKKIIRAHLSDYLKGVVVILLILFVSCAPLILIFDQIIFFLNSSGKQFAAFMVDYIEFFILILAVNFLATFYYFLYEELKGRV